MSEAQNNGNSRGEPALLVHGGFCQGKVFLLCHPVETIGRNARNSIVIPDSSVSRFHAQIARKKNLFYLQDLHSKYGSYVDLERCDTELPLREGSRIRIGRIEMSFSHAMPEDDSALRAVRELDWSSPLEELVEDSGSRDTISWHIPAKKVPSLQGLSERDAGTLARLAESMQSVFDLDERLAVLMDILFEVFQPDRGAVLLFNQEDGIFEARLQRPVAEDLLISRTILDYANGQKKAVLVLDAAKDERFSQAQSIITMAIRSAICAPLIHRNNVLGTIYLDSRAHTFTYQKEDLTLLNMLAAYAAISIENALLVKQKLESERLAAFGIAVAGISHYTKNVLTGMTGSAGLIDLALLKGDLTMLSRVWPMMRQSTQTISALVQDMLSYAKQREPDWQEWNLNRIVSDIFQNQASRAEELQIEMVLQLDDAMPDCLLDPKSVYDALLNILTNAIDACRGAVRPHITLSTQFLASFDQVQAVISDSGPGVPHKLQEKIFEPFFSTKGSQGTGLGLALARKSIQEHGGQLTLESDAGCGASFCATLPRRRIKPLGQ